MNSRDVVFDETACGFEKELSDSTKEQSCIRIELESDDVQETDEVTEIDQTQSSASERIDSSTVESHPILRRSTTIRQPPDYYGTYMYVNVAENAMAEPHTVKQAKTKQNGV